MSLEKVEARWNIELPMEMEAVSRIEPNQGVMVGGKPVVLPWPPLSPDLIATAKDTTQDWQLDRNHVPIMGDFHDLVCLDYSGSDNPEIVIIDDDRNELARFETLKQFLGSLVDLGDTSQDQKGIIEEESWLDF